MDSPDPRHRSAVPRRRRYLAATARADGVTRLGRSLTADVELDDTTVSRRHALIVRGDGKTVLLDDGSRNGICLNGVRVDRAVTCSDGDTIRLGSTELRYAAGGRATLIRRVTFSPWIARCALVRRASGSGASARSPSRYARSSRRIASARVPSIGPPWPGHDLVGLLDQRLQPAQRRQVGGDRPARREHRDLDRREVVAGHQHPRPRDPDRHPVDGVPVGRVQLQRPLADVDVPRHVEPLRARQRQRLRPRDVELVVEVAQLAAAPARLVDQPRRGRLRRAQRRLRERVARRAGDPSRRASSSSPTTLNSACSAIAGRISSSSGKTGESMQNASPPVRTSTHAGREGARGDGDDVFVEPYGAHTHAAPSSFAASSSVFTSAVGFFCDASSVSLLRLTQITGIFALMHGSTS